MLRGFIVIISLCLLNACAILDISDELSYGYQNQRIPAQLLKQIEPQKTTEQWIIENLGNPTSRFENADGSCDLSYQFEENRNRKIRFFILFRYRSVEVLTRHVTIRLDDGVVTSVSKDYRSPGDGETDELGI